MASPAGLTSGLADSVYEELWFGDSDPARTDLEASRSMAASVAKATGLKPFPPAASQLLSLLGREDYDIKAVQRVLEGDVGLASRLLQMANSAAFGARHPCTSIEDAVVHLGRRHVQDMAITAVSLHLFSDTSGMGREFLEHCVSVGGIARALARHWRFPGVDQIFVAGLLHDIGKLLSRQTREIDYATFDPEALELPDVVHLHERRLVGYDHAVLGAHVVRAWNIAEPIPTVVAYHHQPGRAFSKGGPVGLMVALIRIADRIDFEMRSSHFQVMGDELAAALEKDEAMQFADLQVDKLRDVWDLLVDARRAALALTK